MNPADPPRAADRPAAVDLDSSPSPTEADPASEKQLRKLQKLAADAQRPLDAWERYRALVDALDEGHQLLEIADRKARFALVIMGALNVLTFLLATRGEFVDRLAEGLRSWLGAYLIVYAFVSVYFFLQAIEALRPRRFHPRLQYPGQAGPEHFPVGIRYHQDVVARDVEAHRRAWREVRLGQLSAEVAVQTHILARTNQDKYVALGRLYAGLRVMTLLAAGLVTAIAFAGLSGEGSPLSPRLKAGKPGRGGLNVLGSPERMTASGTREPSGVACDRRSARLYVVGDEGTLATLDSAGNVLARHKVKGDLEDVALHSPSGQLVLLSEKKSELVVYDPMAREERRRFKLEDVEVLGQEPADKNQGFEGLAFREDPLRAGGGIFYLVHQRSPAMVVAVSFDLQRQDAALGADVVVDRWPLPGHKDLTGATYVAELDRLLVIADARDRILALRMDGSVEAEVVLPGLQQEGLCLDEAGSLWIADDRGGLLRFPGALDALRGALGKEPA